MFTTLTSRGGTSASSNSLSPGTPSGTARAARLQPAVAWHIYDVQTPGESSTAQPRLEYPADRWNRFQEPDTVSGSFSMMPSAGPPCKAAHTARCQSRYAWMTRCRASLGEEAVEQSAAGLTSDFKQGDHTSSSYLRKECWYNRHDSDSFCSYGRWGVVITESELLVINTKRLFRVKAVRFSQQAWRFPTERSYI